MSNISFTGFHPWMNSGATATQAIRRRAASGNGTAIFTGDLIKRTAAGVWGLATANAGAVGACMGASFFDASINGRRDNPFLPVSTTYSGSTFDMFGETDESFLYLTPDPVNTKFQCQYSASTPALADLTKNADFAAGAGGSTVTGISSHVLNQATIAATAALDLTIVDIKHNVLNDPLSTGAKVIVTLNQGVFPPFSSTNPGTSGV